MRASLWEVYRYVADYLLTMTFYMLASVAMHAAFHYSAVTWLGGRAEVSFTTHALLWTGDIVRWVEPLPPGSTIWHYAFCYWAGGGLTGVFLILKLVFDRDIEDRLFEAVLGGFHLGYATIGEMWAPWVLGGYRFLAALGGLIGALIGFTWWARGPGKEYFRPLKAMFKEVAGWCMRRFSTLS